MVHHDEKLSLDGQYMGPRPRNGASGVQCNSCGELLQNLPVELEEACFVDGGGPWKCMFFIFLPLAKPMIATISLFTIVTYWNEFFQGMVLSTKQSSYPLQTYIQQMVVTLDFSSMNADQIAQAMKLNNLSLDAAKIFVAMIPVLIVYPFLQKYFVSGITLGSVKG